MKTQKYPIGVQTFSKIITDGFSYVDKTRFIKPLLEHGQFIFLSRPRRFGKSLLVSTLEAYFEGRKELFQGLAVDKMDIAWTPSPVLYFDFNAEDYTREDGVLQILHSQLSRLEKRYGIEDSGATPSQRFSRLIEGVYHQTGRGVAILVDEYDKPLLATEHDLKLFEKNQSILKGFFGNLKSMDRYIRFCFITGVARFNKVSIFSDLNNLDDISLTDEFADICGWTEDELLETFSPGIEKLSTKRGESFKQTLKALRDYYDGYLFTEGGSRLYNPFSVLRALRNKKISPFWYETGTPTFLARRVRRRGTFPPDLNGQYCSEEQLLAIGEDDNPVPLMFQTGYLTIASYNEELGLYELRFPNREVEIGFYKNLLPIYAPITKEFDSPLNFVEFQKDIYEGRPEKFMSRLATLLKDLPGEDHNESTYRAITYLMTVLCATYSSAERRSYKGRSDIEVETRNYVYIFEFKYNKTVKEAMDQIYSRDYAGRYGLDSRRVYLIGANFIEKKDRRGLYYEIVEFSHTKDL